MAYRLLTVTALLASLAASFPQERALAPLACK